MHISVLRRTRMKEERDATEKEKAGAEKFHGHKEEKEGVVVSSRDWVASRDWDPLRLQLATATAVFLF